MNNNIKNEIKRPMTTAELFKKIVDILKENGKLPDILDYYLADEYNVVPVTTCEFGFGNNLEYGGSEGIYLGLHIKFNDKTVHMGTFKTLDNSNEAMHVMASLLADFIIEGSRYVNKNLDDFTWEGVDVGYIDEEGNSQPMYSCSTMERALIKKDEMLKKYEQVVVRDNATRNVKIYKIKKTDYNNKMIMEV